MTVQTILATGASGLVGSRFGELFPDKYQVASMDLDSGVNITDKPSIERFVADNPSPVLIHLAAFTNTNDAFKDAGNTSGVCYRVNVEGTRNIAEVARANNMYLIHISTDFVFDGTNRTAYTEEDTPSPIEWYGETKAMAEDEVRKSGVKYAIVRLAYPYRAKFAAKPDLIMKIRTGLESGTLYPQFTDTVITPTFIDDIARGFDALITAKPEGIYHFTGSSALSPYELARKVATAYGFDPGMVKEGTLTEYLKTNPRPFARYAAISNAKATKDLGLHFADIDEGLEIIKKQQEE